MDTSQTHFLAPDPSHRDQESAAAVILPVPLERSTSYGQGTARGPEAVLAASTQVEWYDEELRSEPIRRGIATLPPVALSEWAMPAILREIQDAVSEQLEARKFVVTVGGEHSLSLAPVRAARERFQDIGVVQFDAHADLRDEYEGSPYSHASVMKRILDLGIPSLPVGIRSLSAPEGELIREHEIPVLWGFELDRALELWDSYLDLLPRKIYLTFDVDFFDPSLLPATGTPEPGGGFWWPTLKLLRRLFTKKEVVAMDVVELAPIPGQPSSDFVTARLIYKCLGYRTLPTDSL
ncbi:MAG: agmatinase [Deltaproteobacteria bacterium]|nr:agmatinase [Deltaproteobacteria bacterium]